MADSGNPFAIMSDNCPICCSSCRSVEFAKFSVKKWPLTEVDFAE